MLATNPVTTNLLRARELIADEKNWCTYALQQTRYGVKQYCAWGALEEVSHTMDEERILRRASDELYYESPAVVNNTMGHAAVMAMFDRAIKLSFAEPHAEPV